jgi:hypothetical protein
MKDVLDFVERNWSQPGPDFPAGIDKRPPAPAPRKRRKRRARWTIELKLGKWVTVARK